LDQLVAIAKITKIHGIRGEVVAFLLTDFPERFRDLGKVYLKGADCTGWEEIERFRFHKNRVILKFRGRERPETVQDLVGCELQIPESERVELPEDTYFDSDLRGCAVLEGEVALGSVTDVFKAGQGTVNLVVTAEDGREFMVPLVKEFVLDISVRERVIRVKLPPGLVDLAVDLSSRRGTKKRSR
jgi:16S rRNA processing protein RimM